MLRKIGIALAYAFAGAVGWMLLGLVLALVWPSVFVGPLRAPKKTSFMPEPSVNAEQPDEENISFSRHCVARLDNSFQLTGRIVFEEFEREKGRPRTAEEEIELVKSRVNDLFYRLTKQDPLMVYCQKEAEFGAEMAREFVRFFSKPLSEQGVEGQALWLCQEQAFGAADPDEECPEKQLDGYAKYMAASGKAVAQGDEAAKQLLEGCKRTHSMPSLHVTDWVATNFCVFMTAKPEEAKRLMMRQLRKSLEDEK